MADKRSGQFLRPTPGVGQTLMTMPERQERWHQMGMRLRALRNRCNLRQEDVAAAFGTSNTNVSAWEAGRREIPDSLRGHRRLASACKLSLPVLLDYLEERMSEEDLDLYVPRRSREHTG